MDYPFNAKSSSVEPLPIGTKEIHIHMRYENEYVHSFVVLCLVWKYHEYLLIPGIYFISFSVVSLTLDRSRGDSNANVGTPTNYLIYVKFDDIYSWHYSA